MQSTDLFETKNRESSPPSNLSFLPSPKLFFFLLCAYFLLHAISRGLISETLGLDDSEQILVSQNWSWGYGAQPPLYTWLVICFTKALGFSSFTMALLKNILLLGLYLLTYFTTRKLTKSHPAAVVATVALQFMPSISWEAQRDLTHTILTSLMVLATTLAFLNLKPASWKSYLLFGLCAGLGTISKYNFLVFFVALLLAGLCLPAWRPLILNRRMAGALLLWIAIATPNLYWFATHRELALSKAWEFKIDSTGSSKSILNGLTRWANSALGQFAPLAAILGLIFCKPIKNMKRLGLGGGNLLLHTLLWSSALIALGICIFAVSACHHRWLQPILISMPIMLVAAWHEHLTPARAKAILLIGGIVSLIVLAASPARILLTEKLQKNEILNVPFRQLARQLEAPLAHSDYIYAEDHWLAGNLRMWFPKKHFTAPSTLKLYPLAPDSAIIWDATENRPETFALVGQRLSARPYGKPEYFQQQLKYHRTNTIRLGLLLPQ